MILARRKVNSDGYQYAKGKSRSSCSQSESDENSKVKRKKTDADERAREIMLLNENISTLESRVKYKQQMLQKAQSVNNFKLCDDISGDIISVRKELRIAESQLSAIKKKQVKSEWYHNKKHKKNKDKLTKKRKDQHQQGESSSSIIRHFTSPTGENNKADEKNASEQRKENSSIPIDSDSSSSGTDDMRILSDSENFQESLPNLPDVWEDEMNAKN